VGQREDLFGILPEQDLLQRVGAGDEVQLGRRPAHLAQVTQCVDGVRGARALDVDPADLEPRVGRCRDNGHQVPVLGRADLDVALLPRLAGGHEHDLVEREPVGDLARGDEVTVVDRVERAAHDSDTTPGYVHPRHGSRPASQDRAKGGVPFNA
jgi:hypothetical protein